MHNTRNIVEDIYWIGASDRVVTRFENMFPLTEGIAYNSYLILDEKTAIIDTVDNSVSDVYLENIEYLLQGRTLDYLVINHMEPDHCANIQNVVFRYPNVKLVGNAKTFKFLEQFYDGISQENYLFVKEKDEIVLGKHTLSFHFAPLVHWPEVMVTFEHRNQILFSSDAFGSFGALNGNIFSDEVEFNINEFRRYYTSIIGKFGLNVQALLKKIDLLQPKMIAALHGVIYRNPKHIQKVLGLYQTWSKYIPEKEGVVIAYASMYGNTAEVCQKLATMLAKKDIKNIQIFDVSHTHPSYIISKIFEYSHIVVASPNYNTRLYFPMETLLSELAFLNIQNRSMSFITNTSWGGNALTQSKEIFAKNKNIEIIGEDFEIKSSMKENQIEQLEQLATAIVEKLKKENN